MEEEIRSESLPNLVSLQPVEWTLGKVSGEERVRLTDKGDPAIDCQRAEARLDPIMPSRPTPPRQPGTEHICPPEVNMAITNGLTKMARVFAAVWGNTQDQTDGLAPLC